MQIALADQSLYLRLKNNTIMHLVDISAAPNDREWITADTGGRNVDIACASGLLVFRRNGRSLWRYMGIDTFGQPVIRYIDSEVPILSVATMSKSGAWFVVTGGGGIWQPLS